MQARHTQEERCTTEPHTRTREVERTGKEVVMPNDGAAAAGAGGAGAPRGARCERVFIGCMTTRGFAWIRGKKDASARQNLPVPAKSTLRQYFYYWYRKNVERTLGMTVKRAGTHRPRT